MATRAFVLPPEQVQRAIDAGGPLLDLQVDPAKLAEMQVAVVEVDGAIVAYWVVWRAVHVEPLWIAEAHRKSPSVIGGIVGAMRHLVKESGDPAAFCVIEQEHFEVVSDYAARLGFHEAPGRLYYFVVEPGPAPVEG